MGTEARGAEWQSKPKHARTRGVHDCDEVVSEPQEIGAVEPTEQTHRAEAQNQGVHVSLIDQPHEVASEVRNTFPNTLGSQSNETQISTEETSVSQDFLMQCMLGFQTQFQTQAEAMQIQLQNQMQTQLQDISDVLQNQFQSQLKGLNNRMDVIAKEAQRHAKVDTKHPYLTAPSSVSTSLSSTDKPCPDGEMSSSDT